MQRQLIQVGQIAAIACGCILFAPLLPLVPPRLTPAPALAQSQFDTELLRLTNAERTAAGVAPLRLSTQLTAAAQRHAADMARTGQFSHTGSNGSTLVSRVSTTGYRYRALGENIACGNASPAATLRQWMNSPGHRRNILNPSYTEIGFGYATSSRRCSPYWVQVFGTPSR